MKEKTRFLFLLPVTGFFALAFNSCARPDHFDALNDNTTSRSITACEPTNIVPYIQVNDQQWVMTPEIIVAPGSKVKLGPQPVIANGWSWSGGGASGASREQTIYPVYSVYPLASFTNACGSTSYENFSIHVTHVKDWGFESGGFSNWSGYGQYTIVSNNAYFGTYAGRIYSTGGSSGITQTVTGLTPNTNYLLKARVKTTANSVALGVGEFGGGNPSVFTSSNQYVLLSMPFTTGANATSALVYLWRNTSGYAYIDDVIVERNASPSGDAPPIWVEEFNGSALNTNIWTPIRGTEPYTYGTPYNPSSENNGYAKSMVSVSNGNLVIKWENTPITAGGVTYSYTSGTVHSGKSKYFGPGHYIEAKIKFTSTPGLLLAFWLVPVPVDDHWPPEIDVA
ncbi:MAG: family 16 glycosylhydrolase, partial [Niabella sp.]